VKSVVEHPEVPKEEGEVETIRVLEDRYGDRHLAVGHHRQPKKQTQGDGGSWKKLAATHRRLTRRAIPVLCKIRIRMGPGKTTNSGIRGRSRR
jgi:hypothetical protein